MVSGSTKMPAAESKMGQNNNEHHKMEQQAHANHEIFLQAFEKPTQIYRYLRTRSLVSPIFLNRTLSFMRGRTGKRNNSSRKRFRVDTLLEKRTKESLTDREVHPKFHIFTILGFYDPRITSNTNTSNVTVEIIVVKTPRILEDLELCKPEIVKRLNTSANVQTNPSEEQPGAKVSALSLRLEDNLDLLSQNPSPNSYGLIVRVLKTKPPTNGVSTDPSAAATPLTESKPEVSKPNGIHENGTADEDEDSQSAAKRRRLQNGSYTSENNETEENEEESLVLTSYKVDYFKESRCLLTCSDYDLILRPEDISKSPANKTKNHFDALAESPKIRFRLSASESESPLEVDRPKSFSHLNGGLGGLGDLLNAKNGNGSSAEIQSASSSGRSSPTNGEPRTRLSVGRAAKSSSQQKTSKSLNPNRRISTSSSQNGGSKNLLSHHHHVEKPLLIIYNFLCNNARQETEAREDLCCPWCLLNCMTLYALLKHLKLSHPRFLFSYVPIEEGARIDVSVSELYDSTYAGNPHDLIAQPPGYAFSRGGPVQRTPITFIEVCKPKRLPQSLSEFLDIDGDLTELNGPFDGQRPFVTGHNRLYHYSTTNLPLPPAAIQNEAEEDRVDPPWLLTKICRMIDEFSDVNAGEKDFMKMWNKHVQHYIFVGDCQMDRALRTFIEQNGRELLEKNLYRNFVLHCCNLFEFGVVAPSQVFKAIGKFQEFISSSEENENSNQPQNSSTNSKMEKAAVTWRDQRKKWMAAKHIPETRKDFSGIFTKIKEKEQKIATVSLQLEEEKRNGDAGKNDGDEPVKTEPMDVAE